MLAIGLTLSNKPICKFEVIYKSSKHSPFITKCFRRRSNYTSGYNPNYLHYGVLRCVFEKTPNLLNLEFLLLRGPPWKIIESSLTSLQRHTQTKILFLAKLWHAEFLMPSAACGVQCQCCA